MLVRTETALTYAGARVALDAALAHDEQIGGAFNVAVTDAAPGEVDVQFFLNQSATAAGDQPRPTPSAAHVHATEVAGQWLISDLISG